MKAYVNYLLEDIQAAFRPEDFFVKRKKAPPLDELEAKLEEVDNFLNYDQSPVLGKYCGIDRNDFPHADKLEEEDLKLLVSALVKMFESWNILVDLPENLPAEFGYRLVVDLLDRPMPIMQHGFFGMDFCTGNPEGCEFKEYCPCLKNWEEK